MHTDTPSTDSFTALQSLTIIPHSLWRFGWTAAAMRYIVSQMRHSPLRHLRVPDATIHLLHWLTQLRSLHAYIPRPHSDDPPPYARFFQPCKLHMPDHQCIGRDELRRQVLGCREPIEDEGAVSDEQLASTRPLIVRHFVRERLFDGRDGREVFMHMLSQERDEEGRDAAAERG